jgi:Fur family peroxide stress response transcriptional regulator
MCPPLRDVLKVKALAVTAQRAAVLTVLNGNTDHPSVEDIYRQVKARFPYISRATVYNSVKTLIRAGLLQEVLLQPDKRRVDPNISPHHHFKCRRCGRIEDVPYEILTAAQAGKWAKGYHVEAVHVVMEGQCKRCRQGRQS